MLVDFVAEFTGTTRGLKSVRNLKYQLAEPNAVAPATVVQLTNNGTNEASSSGIVLRDEASLKFVQGWFLV